MQRLAIACIVVIAGASCRDADDAPSSITLRVSAGNELSQFDAQRWTGSTSYALDLVYEPLSDHARVVDARDITVTLHRRPASSHDIAALCAGVYYAGIVRRETSEERCVLAFESVAARERFAGESVVLVEVGPFRLDRVLSKEGRPLPVPGIGQGARSGMDAEAGEAKGAARSAHVGAIEMVAHDGTAIDRIRILSMPIQEEWRRLFAGEIDVIPSMPVLYRPRFAGMRSVRTIDLPSSGHVSLYFNTQRAPWSNRALRRQVAAIIDREAVAELACGEPGCAADSWTSKPPAGEAAALPVRFSILVLASHTTGLIAARTISYQLRKHHDAIHRDTEPQEMTIDIEVLPLKDMYERAKKGDFDLQIAPLGFLSPAGADNAIGVIAHCAAYTRPAFASALRAGDVAQARQILADDVPVLPLYENRKFAAVDTYFCGGAPSNQVSWAWLADLHPCEEGAPR